MAVEFGVHLPLIDFAGEGLSFRRLAETVDAARECGFSSLSANDHFLFSAPWLDGPTALVHVTLVHRSPCQDPHEIGVLGGLWQVGEQRACLMEEATRDRRVAALPVVPAELETQACGAVWILSPEILGGGSLEEVNAVLPVA